MTSLVQKKSSKESSGSQATKASGFPLGNHREKGIITNRSGLVVMIPANRQNYLCCNATQHNKGHKKKR